MTTTGNLSNVSFVKGYYTIKNITIIIVVKIVILIIAINATSTISPRFATGNTSWEKTLRGNKYIIFGNIEKIYEFHSKRFYESLNLCRGHPYALGAAFMKHRRDEEEDHHHCLDKDLQRAGLSKCRVTKGRPRLTLEELAQDRDLETKGAELCDGPRELPAKAHLMTEQVCPHAQTPAALLSTAYARVSRN
ncbi:hypothetical protein HELRODRAFT_176049 [Helobdella robusta]|uniref:Uncharacterized protein n=1 Tax=Helobdella robusta TaxID=6412 RepID=T1FA30_HELRO|nr:hypothetical protein HELRODRAFT_176049 [Helobdella robusta]ESO00211.1 hypothetical protein HELRODRAFT_176049 [Helobdella robusta]